MNKQIEGVITDKKPYIGDNPKAPAGTIFISRDKYTCWRADIFAKLNIGSKVVLNYTEQENTYEGKTFINKNIMSIGENSKVDESDIGFSEQEEAEKTNISNGEGPLEGIPFKSEPFKVGGFTYRIVGTLELQ